MTIMTYDCAIYIEGLVQDCSLVLSHRYGELSNALLRSISNDDAMVVIPIASI